MPPSFQQLRGLLLNSCTSNATNQEGAARGGAHQPHHKHDNPPQPSPPTACGTADDLLKQDLQGQEGDEEGVTHTMSDMTALSTDTYIAAVAEAAARKRPLLSSATLPGVAASAVLDTPTEEPRAPSHDFHVLLIRGAAGAAAAAAALGLLGWLAFKGICFLMGGTLPVLMTWCAVEAGFWVWFRQHAARLDEQPRPHMPCNQDPLLHFRRLIAHARFYRDTCRRPVDWESYVSMWFRGAPVPAVGMENLKEMVAYGFFYRTKSELVASGEWPLVEAMVAELCGMSARDGAADTSTVATGLEPTGPANSLRRGRTLAVIKPGYTQGLQYMAHLWEPLRWNHRPLAMYIGTEAISLITATFLCAIGFRVGVHQGGRYFYRPAQPGSGEKARSPQQPHTVPATGISTGAAAASAATVPDQSQGHNANDSSAFGKVAALTGSGSGSGVKLAPIVCLHGVGLGVTPYLLFVVRLAASRAPMLVPEFAHIGLRLCARVPCCSEVADRVAATMSHVGITKACVVAHSYGTFIASRMVQAHSGRVHSLALIDPVCFGMFLPSLLNNFVYRTPRDVLATSGLAAAAKACLLYLIARDVHCATSVCRRFYWTDVNLWAEELPALSLVVLSGRDELMHADEVRQVVAGGQYIGIRRGPCPMTSAEAFPHMSSSNPDDAATDAAAVHAAAPDAPILPLPHTLYTIPSSVSAHEPGSPTQPTTPPLTPPNPNTLSTSSITRCEPNSSTDVTDQGAAAHCTAHTGHAATDSQVSQSSQLQPPPQQRTVSVDSNWGPLLEGLAAPPANARMLYHPTASHADFLLDNGWQAEVVEQVLCLAAEEPTTQQVARRRTTIVGSSSIMGPGPYLGSSSMHTSRMGSMALASAAASRMGSLEEGHGSACGPGAAGTMQRGGGAPGTRYPTSSGHEASAWAGGGSGWGGRVCGEPLGAAAWGVPGAGDVRDTHVREARAVVAMFKQQQSVGQAGPGGQRGGGTLRQRAVAAAAPVECSPGRSSGGVLDCAKLAAGSSPAGDPGRSRVQGLGAVLACVERSPSLPAVARKGSAGAVAGAHNWVDLRSF